MKFHEERKSKFMTIKGTFISIGDINMKLDLLVPRVSSTFEELQKKEKNTRLKMNISSERECATTC